MKAEAHFSKPGRPGPSRSRAFRALRAAERIFLLTGLLALGSYGFVIAEAKFYQVYEGWRFDQIRRGLPASKTVFLKQKLDLLTYWVASLYPAATWPENPENEEPRPRRAPVPPAAPESPGQSPSASESSPAPGLPSAPSLPVQPQKRASPGDLIGRIEIPRLGLSAMIVEGDDDGALRLGVGHIPGTALPGQPGNVGLTGHRDSFFRPLKNLHKYDTITVSTLEGDHRYAVQSLSIVGPRDVAVLRPAGQPLLTLVTCYPFEFIGHAPRRFIVQARELSGHEAAEVKPASASGSISSARARPSHGSASRPARRALRSRKPAFKLASARHPQAMAEAPAADAPPDPPDPPRAAPVSAGARATAKPARRGLLSLPKTFRSLFGKKTNRAARTEAKPSSVVLNP